MIQATQKTMQAAAINRLGGLETIMLQTLPVPEVGPDEVLIRVESAGVAVWDVFEREGGFAERSAIEPKFPFVLGSRCWTCKLSITRDLDYPPLPS